jgi:heterodisulfide reductase subunit A2
VKGDAFVPKDIAFIKCVGSRDKSVGNEYCSRVCCMYTAKLAHLVKEKSPDANVRIYYMDVRAFGKGFEEFYDRVRGKGSAISGATRRRSSSGATSWWSRWKIP